MSNQTNSLLIEEALDLVDYFEGKLPAKLIRQDLQNHDLESLQYHVKQARDMMFDLEYRPDEASDVV